MIVKREESAQYSIFPPEHKPLYKNCKTCSRLVPDGKCEYCGVNEYRTSTPWERIKLYNALHKKSRGKKEESEREHIQNVIKRLQKLYKSASGG